ncbi:MAG: S8 family serine peptidase [Phycisphaerales bacterium]|nr:S8 family serine peptidase [Phycisphaerales bacterium]
MSTDASRSTLQALILQHREAVARGDRPQRVVLQLDGPLTAAHADALAAAGVVLGEYLPVHAFVADLTRVDPVRAASLVFVRWAGEFQQSWKLAPELGRLATASPERRALAEAGLLAVNVTLFWGADAARAAADFSAIPGVRIHRAGVVGQSQEFTLAVPAAAVPLLATNPDVLFVEDAPEFAPRNVATRWIVQTNTPGSTPLYGLGLNGAGQIVAVIDGPVDFAHCSFADPVNPIGPLHRKVLANNAAPGGSPHGTHVAATLVGDAGDWTATRGVAWGARMVFNTIPSPLAESSVFDRLSLHHAQGARIHSNSYGNDATTAYDGTCRAIDAFSWANEDSLVVFAVSNTDTLKNPENAKNALAVGAADMAPNQAMICFGGSGPTVDGRRKPEVFAPGCSIESAAVGTGCLTFQLSGTSMATPGVAGAATLVRQYFTDGYYPSGVRTPAAGFVPTSALVKAVMVTSAADMTSAAGPAPNFQEGFGRVTVWNTLMLPGSPRKLIVRDVRRVQGLATGGAARQTFSIAPGAPPLKATLVWTEPPAAAGAGFAPINDLDLELTSPDGQIFRGNSFVNGVTPPSGAKDALNNVEQVVVASPAPGVWTLRVLAAAVNVGPQGFSTVISGDVTPVSRPLVMSTVSAAPQTIAPGAFSPVQVRVDPGDDQIGPGGVALVFRDVAGGVWRRIPLADGGGGLYTGWIPAPRCPGPAQWYVTADGVASGTVSDPPAGASAPRTATVGGVSTLADDNFQTDTGWRVNVDGLDDATRGIWQRMVSEGTAAQPDGGTTGPGTLCWVTDGRAGTSLGDNDVDDGRTTLYSPIFDVSGAATATVTYTRWYSNSAGSSPNQDVFRVQVSADGGSNWVPLENVGPAGPETNGGWYTKSFPVESFVPLTNRLRFRFIAEDAPPGSIVEAALDDFKLTAFRCVQPPACPGDVDGNGAVGANDLTLLLTGFGKPGGGPADLDGNGTVGANDLTTLLLNFGLRCW